DFIREIWHLPDGDAKLVRGADHELVLAGVVLFFEGVVGGRKLTRARRQKGEQGAEKKRTDATKRKHTADPRAMRLAHRSPHLAGLGPLWWSRPGRPFLAA